MEDKNKDIKKRNTWVAIGVTGIMLGGFVVGILLDGLSVGMMKIILGGWLVFYMVLFDVVEPWEQGRFVGITEERRGAYLKFLALDAAGNGALAWYVFSLGTEHSVSVVVLLVYVLAMRYKPGFKRVFLGEEKRE